jgi:hypothetical protein
MLATTLTGRHAAILRGDLPDLEGAEEPPHPPAVI